MFVCLLINNRTNRKTNLAQRRNPETKIIAIRVGSPCGAVVKSPPAKTGNTRNEGSILGQKDPLEKDMATFSSIHAWKIPWTEEPGRL